MTEAAYQALESLGSALTRNVGYRDSWALIGWKLGLRRFHLLALLTLAAGVGIFIVHLGDLAGLAALSAAQAVLLGCSGLFTLLAYLRRNPPPGQEEA